MTGRAAGYCAGYPTPGYLNPVPGRGWGFWGWGRGGGRGWRNWYYATGLPGWVRAGWPAWGGVYSPYAGTLTREQELKLLQDQASGLEKSLDEIRKRIADLESKSEE